MSRCCWSVNDSKSPSGMSESADSCMEVTSSRWTVRVSVIDLRVSVRSVFAPMSAFNVRPSLRFTTVMRKSAVTTPPGSTMFSRR